MLRQMTLDAIVRLYDAGIEARAFADYWASGQFQTRRQKMQLWAIRRYGAGFQKEYADAIG